MSDVWTAPQIRVALGSIFQRLERDNKAFSIKKEGKEFRYSNYAGNQHIYLNLEESTYRVYLSIGGHSGTYMPSKKGWFWQTDHDYNAIITYIKDLRAMANHNGETAGQALLKAFPEAVDIEFEDTILKRK